MSTNHQIAEDEERHRQHNRLCLKWSAILFGSLVLVIAVYGAVAPPPPAKTAAPVSYTPEYKKYTPKETTPRPASERAPRAEKRDARILCELAFYEVNGVEATLSDLAAICPEVFR